MKVASLLSLAAAAVGAQPTSITMKSNLESKINMGNAVLNTYCKSDLQPSFSRVYDEAVVTKAGVANTITVGLVNVATSCAGNFGVAPCATTAGKDRFPSFVCTFTSPDGSQVASDAVQGLRIADMDEQSGQFCGFETLVKCEMPPHANFEHDVTVTLDYNGKTKIPIPFSGKAGDDAVHISATASPTKSPTKAPTKAPTTSPTLAPTLPPTTSGCNSVVLLNSYYRSCRASSEKPSQFFSARHTDRGGIRIDASSTYFYFARVRVQARNFRFFNFYYYFYFGRQSGTFFYSYSTFQVAFTSTEMRSFFCGNSRPEAKLFTFGNFFAGLFVHK
jgi:hypothetical protein